MAGEVIEILALPVSILAAAGSLVGIAVRATWIVCDRLHRTRTEVILERLGLANDRLKASQEELAKIKEQVGTLDAGTAGRLLEGSVDRVIVANAATTAVSGAPSTWIFKSLGAEHFK